MWGEIGKHLGIWCFFGLMFFFGYVLLASSPLSRIERTCLPTEWAGTALVSTAGLFSAEAEVRTDQAMGEFTVACQYLVYRQFFRDDYLRLRAAEEARQAQEAARDPEGATP